MPRTLTQNFMNNGSVFDNRQSQSVHGFNTRSESQRRNIESLRMDQIVNQLRSERIDEDNDIFTQENIDNLSNSGNNNFDRTASPIEVAPSRTQARRPITRAAGYDSRVSNFDIPELTNRRYGGQQREPN